MATEKVKVISIDTNPASKSVKELRQELKGLRDTLLNTEKGTEEYNEAMRQAADIQHTLKEQMEEVNANAMDFGQIVGNTTKAVGGLMAGFQAATAVMNLFGIENEEVVKSIQKMQNIMALTQAFAGIDNGIKAFRRLAIVIQGTSKAFAGLSRAMIATGIGAAVVAVGLLAANWDKVTEALRRWGIVHNSTAEKLREQSAKMQELRNNLAKLQEDYDTWLKNDKISKLSSKDKKAYDALTKSIEGYSKQLDIVEAKRKLAANNKYTTKEQYNEIIAEANALQELIKNAKDAQDAILNTADANNELSESAKKATEDAQKQRQKEQKDYNNALEKRYAAEDKVRKDKLKAEQELADRVKEIGEKIKQDEEEDLNNWAENLSPSVEKALSVVNSLRSAFRTPDEQYNEELNALQVALDNKLIAQTEYNRLSEALAKEHLERQRTIAVQESMVWMSALGNLSNVFSSIADTIDRGTEEGEEQYKALMYTSTIVSTLAGVGGAIASAFMPVNAGMTIWGQIAMAATTSASVLASGIAQLVQIKNASSNSSLGGTNIGSSISSSAVSTVQAPLQFTQAVQGANIESAISRRNMQKVYVTETDITNTQNKVRVTENEARF